MPALRTLTSTLLALTVIGCKTEQPPEEQPPAPLAVEDAAEQLARQICAGLFACSCSATGFDGEDACVDQLSADFQSQIDDLLAWNGSWNAECAGQLLAAWSDWECLGPVSARRQANYDARVCPVVKGTLAAGDPCIASQIGDECGEGSVCVAGVCIDTDVPVPLGSECEFDWQELPCAADSYCGYGSDGESRTCLALPVAGDPCDGGYQCGPSSLNLVCDYDTQTCVIGPAAGEPCHDGISCGPGLYCDGGKDFTCQERFELGDGCAADAVCPVDASCINNFCQADPPAVCSLGNYYLGPIL